MSDASTIKAEPVESVESGGVKESSKVLTVENDVENTEANSPSATKEQDLHEAVLTEKVLSDEAGKEQESKGNKEESGEEENESKDEEWMVVDEDDDVDELDESIAQEKELAKEKGNGEMDQEMEGQQERPPRTLLATITVNIGPLRMEDLDSPQMRDILNYSKGYTLTFEKKEEGLLSKEKERARHEGFVKIPYEFYNDAYLVKTHNKLRNLHIDNRDLSVTFPEEFLKIFEECTTRIKLRQERRRKIQDMRKANVESKKKSLFAKNIPPNIQEETLKAEFPGCTNVIIPKNSEGISIGFAVLEFETMGDSKYCLQTHDMKDIQNHRIHLSKIAFDGTPDGYHKKGHQQKGNQWRGSQTGNQGRNQQQRENHRWENQRRGNRRNRHGDDRSRSGDRRNQRNDQSRRQSGPYSRDVQMPPPLMSNFSTWSRYDNGRGGGEADYNWQNHGSGPKRSRSQDGRDQKRFRGDTRQGNGSGWGGPANTGRNRSPDGEAETLSYLRQQLSVMEKKLVHSQPIPAAGVISSSGRSYGGGLTGKSGGYSTGTQASGYGSSARPASGHPSSGYTSSGYNYSGYEVGSHTSDSLLGSYPSYPSGGQPHTTGGSSRIEDAYNMFMNSISGQ